VTTCVGNLILVTVDLTDYFLLFNGTCIWCFNIAVFVGDKNLVY